MGMSSRLTGFISDKDETYQKHAKVLRACLEADISELPKETAKYFGSKYPEEHLLEEKLEVKIPYDDYSEDMTQGFEIEVAKIPLGVHKIRFTNSW